MDTSYLKIIQSLKFKFQTLQQVIRDQKDVIRHHEAAIQSLEIKIEALESKLLQVRKIFNNYCKSNHNFLFIFLLHY